MNVLRDLNKRLTSERQSNIDLLIKRNDSKTPKERAAWQTLVDLCEENQKNLKKQIETMKNSGLKKPTVRGLKKVCSHVVKATGLKVDGTLKKGYKYATGGKIVKVAPAKKPVAKKKPAVKKKAATKKTTVKK